MASDGLNIALLRELAARAHSGSPRDEVFAGASFHAPLSNDALDNAESRLDFRLPNAVRDMYGRVANGGFGPGYGSDSAGASSTEV